MYMIYLQVFLNHFLFSIDSYESSLQILYESSLRV